MHNNNSAGVSLHDNNSIVAELHVRASYLRVGQDILSIDVTIVGLCIYSDLDDHEGLSVYSHTKDSVCGS